MDIPPVLLPDEIVPFFINVIYEGQRLFEIIQVKYSEADAEEITNSLVQDMSLSTGFRQAVNSFLDTQLDDYKKLTELVPKSEWAQNGSAVHILNIECSTASVVYSDRFEWDVFDRTMDPDVFARLTIKELGLPAEFINSLSAQIRWQSIRLRAMHAYPDQLNEYIAKYPIAAPQIASGLRPITELIDYSPVVGLKPGRDHKSSVASKERDLRAIKRQNRALASSVLHLVEDTGITQIKLVPTVRAVPSPEDSVNIDLAAVPQLINEEDIVTDEALSRVIHKLDQAKFTPTPRQMSDNDSDDFFD